ASSEFAGRLKRMYEALDTLADQQGRVPQVGDGDDGRVELLTDDLKQFTEFAVRGRDSMRLGSWIGLGRALLKADFGRDSSDAVWYGLENGVVSHKTLPPRHFRVFSSSGIAAARYSDLDVLLFAMPNGINGKGSHTHNDKLSVIVK